MIESRRSYNRVPFFETCTVARDTGERATYKTLDLGAGGFAFQCDEIFKEGEKITAVFGEDIKEDCVIAYCVEYEKNAYKVGVNFLKARNSKN